METRQCSAKKHRGERCDKMCTIGVELCSLHMIVKKKLQIKQSTFKEAGNGLFAVNNKASPSMILFRAGDKIIDYIGEKINKKELERRYGSYTAPYAIRCGTSGNYIDSASCRGIGSMINHRSNRPNCEFVSKPKQDGILVIALVDIVNGAELFANYGEEFEVNEILCSHFTSN